MGNTVHKTSIILSAVDKMSRVVNKAFKNTHAKMAAINKRSKVISAKANEFGRNSAGIAVAVAAPLVLATKKAIEFEEAMADVSKVLGFKRGSDELNAMSKGAQDLALHLAKSPVEAAAMVAALAQGGIIQDQILNVGKFTGEMAVAFDVAGERAGNAFTKTQNALGITTERTKGVMNAVNLLSDSVAAKAPQLLDFLSGGGASAANILKTTGAEAAAVGATFIAMGKSGAEAGTMFRAMSRGLTKDNQISKLFRAGGGGLDGIIKVFEAGNKLSGAKKSAFFSQFGLYGTDIANAASNMELLGKTTALVADKTQFADSVGKEFANRANTRAFKLAQLTAKLEILAIKVGNTLLPVIDQLADILGPMMSRVSAWIEANPKLTSQMTKVALVIAAVSAAASILAFVVGGVSTAVSVLSSVGMLLAANPIGAIIAAIAIAGLLIIRNWEPIKAFFVNLWDGIKVAFNRALTFMRGVKAQFLAAGTNIITAIWDGMKGVINRPVEAIQNMVAKMRDYLPFSPAKIGPLSDIHRLKLVETIAATIRPEPVILAMQQVAGGIANVGGITPSGSGSGGTTINFAPVISIGGGGDPGDIKSQVLSGLRSFSGELLQMMDDAKERKERLSF